MNVEITAAKVAAATQVAVEKMIAAGMTEADAVAYVKANLNTVMAYALRLIVTHETK